MLPDIKYETLPVYGQTTKVDDQSQKSLLLKCEQPRLKAALQHQRKRRLLVTGSVIIASVLLIAAILTSYFLLVHHRAKGYKWISYVGQDNEGSTFEESTEVDESSQMIVHFVSGPRFVTSLYLYEMNLMIVKDSQCYVSKYTETFEESLSILQQFQGADSPIKHKRAVYRLTEEMTRAELVELGGEAAGAFCPEHLVWGIEMVDYSLTLNSASSSSLAPPQSYIAETENGGLLVNANGKNEEGSGEERMSTTTDLISYSVEDVENRKSREASQCVGLLTFKAELYPENCP